MALPQPRQPGPLPFLPMLRCPEEGSIECTILSPRLEEIQTHYYHGVGRRPCLADAGVPCDGCAWGVERRPYVYALAVEKGTRRVGVLEITDKAYGNCKRLHQIAPDARGWRVALRKMHRGKRAPVKAGVLGQRIDSEKLPPESGRLLLGLARLWATSPALLRALDIAGDQAEAEQLAGDLAAGPLAGELPSSAGSAADQITRELLARAAGDQAEASASDQAEAEQLARAAGDQAEASASDQAEAEQLAGDQAGDQAGQCPAAAEASASDQAEASAGATFGQLVNELLGWVAAAGPTDGERVEAIKREMRCSVPMPDEVKQRIAEALVAAWAAANGAAELPASAEAAAELRAVRELVAAAELPMFVTAEFEQQPDGTHRMRLAFRRSPGSDPLTHSPWGPIAMASPRSSEASGLAGLTLKITRESRPGRAGPDNGTPAAAEAEMARIRDQFRRWRSRNNGKPKP